MSYIGNTATQQAFTPAVDFFNGNGSTTAFTLSRPVASVAQVQVVISNVPQKPGDAYTVSGNTITFTSAPPSGTQNIYVYYTSPITQVIAPGQGTVGTAQIQNGAVIPADLSTGAPSWDTSGNVTTTGTINNLTVGRGAGAVSTNTAVGASALAANTTGAQNTAVGAVALTTNTTSSGNTAIGWASLNVNTGAFNTAVGRSSLGSNESGANNTALGYQALVLNTTASNNTAVGYQAGYNNTSGAANTFIGGIAGITNTTGNNNTVIGYYAGNANSTGGQNAFLGAYSGALTTSGNNTFVGISAGENVTTGSKNTILGRYNGNQGGLDIRTASNYIVLSDGDGNPRGIFDGSGNFQINQVAGGAKINVTGSSGANAFVFNHTTSGDGVGVINQTNTSFASGMVAWNAFAAAGSGWSFIQGFSGNFSSLRINIRGDGNIYNVNGTYGAISDLKLKENIADATPKLNSLMQVRVVNYNFIGDEQKQIGVIAQELEQIFPGMVDETPDYERVVTTDEDGNEKTEQVSLGTTTKSVKYSVFVPMLIKAIQELKAEFDAYKEAHP